MLRDSPDSAPDPAPAIRLREELARLRADGWSFDAAWQVAERRALHPLQIVAAGADVRSGSAWRDLAEWQAVCNELRPCWKAAYERRDAPAFPLVSAAYA